jgi:hypothetical protein
LRLGHGTEIEHKAGPVVLADYALYVSKHKGRNRVLLWAEGLSFNTEFASRNANSTPDQAFSRKICLRS